jgi:hypothetical protein
LKSILSSGIETKLHSRTCEARRKHGRSANATVFFNLLKDDSSGRTLQVLNRIVLKIGSVPRRRSRPRILLQNSMLRTPEKPPSPEDVEAAGEDDRRPTSATASVFHSDPQGLDRLRLEVRPHLGVPAEPSPSRSSATSGATATGPVARTKSENNLSEAVVRKRVCYIDGETGERVIHHFL